ncbi:hypothetical protein PRK78_000080 [Emydomyces testavorans]|uniref:Uncharacterized protein n=1 Tax=Emydomyces testavorans TaxID=2070801 RepID=A0AAF0DAI8_9EURO|nr:hypothetical protein PRK78_000080 [Emydomyces testavorans]
MSPYPHSLGAFSLVSLSSFATDSTRSDPPTGSPVFDKVTPQSLSITLDSLERNIPTSNFTDRGNDKSSFSAIPVYSPKSKALPRLLAADSSYTLPTWSYNKATPSTLQISVLDRKLSTLSCLKKASSTKTVRTCISAPDPLNTKDDLKLGKDSDLASSLRKSRSLHTTEGSLFGALDHFSAFYILRAKPKRTSSSYASEDVWAFWTLRSTIEISLNIKYDEEKICDFLNDIDANGNETIYLALINRVLTVRSGDPRLLVASIIDVTDFLNYVTYEDMECQKTMKAKPQRPIPPSSNRRDSGGVSSGSAFGHSLHPVSSQTGNDASTAFSKANPSPFGQWFSNGITEDQTENQKLLGDHEDTVHMEDISQVAQQILKEISESLLSLYGEYFILARPQTGDSVYDMSHISPRLCESGEYITAHLFYTPQAVIDRIGELLADNERFSINIKWGLEGLDKRLYCVPLFGQRSRPWLCLLIDPTLPNLWPEENIAD